MARREGNGLHLLDVANCRIREGAPAPNFLGRAVFGIICQMRPRRNNPFTKNVRPELQWLVILASSWCLSRLTL